MKSWRRVCGPLGCALICVVVVGCGGGGRHDRVQATVRIEASLCSSMVLNDFPRRVLFLVDASPGMAQLDPQAHRKSAVADYVNSLAANDQTAIGLIGFAGRPVPLTDGFVSGVDSQVEALAQIGQVGPCQQEGCRDWRSALELARTWIDADLAAMPAHLAARASYEVFLLSGGDAAPALGPTESVDLVEALGSAQPVPVRFHGVLLEDPDDLPESDLASDRLESMAQAAGGEFVRFSSPLQINFWFARAPEPQAGEISSGLVVRNPRVVWAGGEWVSDADGDGLSDFREQELGSDPLSPDTDGDGLEDQFELSFARRGFAPLVPSSPLLCSSLDQPWRDEDGDGWNTCEERLLGTRDDLFDTDGDGFSDQLEVRAGTDPLHADGDGDLDGDGITNRQELLAATDPQAPDVAQGTGLSLVAGAPRTGVRVDWSQPNIIQGLEVLGVSAPVGGAGSLYHYPAGTTRPDGTLRNLPSLAWRAPDDGQHGPEVPVAGPGELVLWGSCTCRPRCGAGCGPGETCQADGVCGPDPCALLDCPDGFRCDPLQPGCEPWTDWSVCAAWECSWDMRVEEKRPDSWIRGRVDPGSLALTGTWCDGGRESEPCTSDDQCQGATLCRARENLVVVAEPAGCRSFAVDGVPLGPDGSGTIIEVIGWQDWATAGPADLFRRAVIELGPDTAPGTVVVLGDRDFEPLRR